MPLHSLRVRGAEKEKRMKEKRMKERKKKNREEREQKDSSEIGKKANEKGKREGRESL